MSVNSRELILTAGRRTAQTRGYAGLNFRSLAEEVGIKSASVHYHFKTKADLGAAIARRYCVDVGALLEALSADAAAPIDALRAYPAAIFRRSLEGGNRLCLYSFMSAEAEDLPAEVKREIDGFAELNVAWLSKTLQDAKLETPDRADVRAKAIFAAISGAQLMARSRADLSLFDGLIEAYRTAGLLP